MKYVWAPFAANPLPLLYLGLFTTALCNYLQTIGQKDIPAERAAVIYSMDPVYAGKYFPVFSCSVLHIEYDKWYVIYDVNLFIFILIRSIVLYCVVLCAVLCWLVFHYMIISYTTQSPLNDNQTPSTVFFYFIKANLHHYSINSLTLHSLYNIFFTFCFYFSFFFLYFSWRKIWTSRLFWYDINISWCVV